MYHCLPFLPTRMSTRFDSQWHSVTILWLLELPCVKMFPSTDPQIPSENFSWQMDNKNLTNIPNPSLKFPWFLWKQVPWILFKDQRSKQGWMSRFRSTQLMAPLAAAIVMEIFTKSLRNAQVNVPNLCEDVSVLAMGFFIDTPNRSNKKISLSKRNVTSLTKNIWTHIPYPPGKKKVFDPIFSTNILPNQNISKEKTCPFLSSWWFQPIGRIFVKLDHLHRDPGEKQNIWNHHPETIPQGSMYGIFT